MADAEEEEFYSYLPDDFQVYMHKELNWLPSKYLYGGVFWSREDDGPQFPSTLPDGGDISNLNKIIRHLLYTIMHDVYWAGSPVLVQFWAPVTTKEGRSFLTTRNQPFSLKAFYDRLGIEGLCGYRMISMDSKFDIDLDRGKTCEQHLPGRVFKHQFPESTPNVEFYSITEYSQRDDAVRCGVRQSLAFPVFESSTQRCVGVIEVVTPEDDLSLLICDGYFEHGIYEDFEKFGLKCSVVFDHEDMELDKDENEARTIALDEIKNVLEMVCDVHDLPLAHAWVPCEVGCPCRALVDGGILHASCYYKKDDYGEDEDAFQRISSLFHLKNGMGVVGRALLSTNMVFCRDVTQLSLTEYPLAHYARKANLSGCFAICLESNCTVNDLYVLEFFMPMSNNANENPHTSSRKILETMRKKFRRLRVAFREELGEELHIEEISIQNGEKLDPVQIPQTSLSLPQLDLSQSQVGVMQVDSLDQQLANAINTGSNVGGTEHTNFAITCTQEKSTVKVSKRKGNKSEGTVKTSKRDGNNIRVKIKISDILQNSELSLQKAAESLKVSKSTLKRACRGYGIERWPPSTINEAGCSQLNEYAPCFDQVQILQLNSDHPPSIQASATTVHTKPHDSSQLNESAPCVRREQIVHLNSDHLPSTQALATIEPHDTMMQDAKDVTVKAKCGDITMRFYLSLSSSFVEFQEEVFKRRNLAAGTYDVIYVDEGEHVLISIDDDLQDYMRRSRLLGQTSIEVFILPKWQSADVTVKAKCGDITMRFYLSLSSSFVEFQEEVFKRRNLAAGTYDVIYVDEGEHVLISIDDDLQDYMRRSRLLGQTSIEVFILPKWQSAPTEEIDWAQLSCLDQ